MAEYMAPSSVTDANSLVDRARSDASAASVRRSNARKIGGVHHPIAAVSAVEILQSEMLATPSDLVALIRGQWPELWKRILAEARRQGWSPVQQLIHAIEEGLPHHG